MPTMVEGGYLYIAQPPLFKIKRGSAEVYKKDERALDDFLIDEGLKDTRFLVGPEVQQKGHAGDDLRQILDKARIQCNLLKKLADRITAPLIEQAAISGVLNPALLDDEQNIESAAGYIAQRLNVLALPGEDGWSGKGVPGKALSFEHDRRGVVSHYEIDEALINSAEARALNEDAEELQSMFERPAHFESKSGSQVIHGPTELYETV